MDNIRVLHKNILEVAKVFREICDQNGLKYYLLGGTALGAVRHGGFIPWDDDFDVCMDRDDYLKLCSLDNEFAARGCTLVLEDSECFELYFSKVRLNNSVYLEREAERTQSCHKGVYIDVMCLSPGYSNYWLRYFQYVGAKLLNARALSSRGYDTTSRLRKFAMYISRICIKKGVKRKLLKFVRYPPRLDSGAIKNHFFGRAKFVNACIPNNIIGKNQRYIEFEGEYFSVFEYVEKYLEARFGPSYMNMPSQKVKNEYPSHCLEFEPRDDLRDAL
jgi:lipopolysaccharide cholinephosphotransferase